MFNLFATHVNIRTLKKMLQLFIKLPNFTDICAFYTKVKNLPI